jgi:hypothetical protein
MKFMPARPRRQDPALPTSLEESSDGADDAPSLRTGRGDDRSDGHIN